jgi:inosine-uridine nucleoside N-ribohydrolase
MPTKVIIDCDTGSDDAVAIMAAALHPALELVAVTTVNGNVPLENTTDNTLRVLDAIDSRIPVHPGAPRPLVRSDFPIPRDVLNAGREEFQKRRLDLPDPVSLPSEMGAVEAITRHYLSAAGPETVLVAVGPLTNVAAALAAEPRLAARIPRLVIMGGARGWGNVTAAAEFNFWVDPEAAAAVLSAGIADVLIVPLDATHDASLSRAHCARFEAIGTPGALATAALVRQRIATYPGSEHDSLDAAPVHDALCIAALVRPDVITHEVSAATTVETGGAHSVGALVIDDRTWSTGQHNARVALRADSEIFAAVLEEAFHA